MSDYSLKIENLTKKYDDFLLDKVSFYVPKGNIVGLIGENGAGKSTTINTMLDIIERDSGDVYILNSEKYNVNNEIREKIGVVFDGNNFPEDLTPQKLNNVLTRIYKNWEDKTFFEYIEKFNLPKTKKIKNFSKGMKMKLSISVALSHNAELLILDEATSGLDPIVRDDILDILLEFVQDEKKSILISSHITSDLEKVADYIVFIHKGKVIFEETKDNLIYDYGIMKCKQKDFSSIDKEDIIRFRKMDYGYEILVKNKNELERKYPNMVMDSVSESGKILIALICGGLLCGVGIGIAIKNNGSTGGMDVIQRCMSKYLKVPYSKTMYLTDWVVVFISGFSFSGGISYHIEGVVYGVIAVLATSIIIDTIVLNVKSRRTAYIITDHPIEMRDAIYKNIKRGVTFIDCEGGYTSNLHTMVVCTLDKNEAYRLTDYVKAVDPKAFSYITSCKEVIGEYSRGRN